MGCTGFTFSRYGKLGDMAFNRMEKASFIRTSWEERGDPQFPFRPANDSRMKNLASPLFAVHLTILAGGGDPVSKDLDSRGSGFWNIGSGPEGAILGVGCLLRPRKRGNRRQKAADPCGQPV